MAAGATQHLDHPLLREAWQKREGGRRRRAWMAIGVSATVTVVWAIAVTVYGLWPRVLANWPASITMVFGSIVAGSTPQGGGAVAFPVFTKLLEVPAEVARTFSLCIQTIGMGTAALAIIINRRVVEWRSVGIGTAAGVVGFGLVILLASDPTAPFRPTLLQGAYVKVTFTIVLMAMAFVVYAGSRVSVREVHRVLPPLNQRMLITLILVGFIGGGVAALVGSGLDVFVYLAIVVFFTIDPKVGVPTSVICMAMISILAFGTLGIIDQQLFIGLNEAGEVVRVGGEAVTLSETGRLVYGEGPGAPPIRYDLFGLWIASVPIVCWGAPFGSWLASQMTTRRLVQFVTLLAAAEVLSTAVFLKELRTDPVLLAYALIGSAVVLGSLMLISRNRARLFRLPPVDLDASVNADRIDVAGEYLAQRGAGK